MRSHRGILHGLAFAAVALSGFMANRADAGSISLSVDLNGTVIYTATSVSPDQSVAAVLNSVNTALGAHGSAYRFTALSAQSNFTGGSNGLLATTFQLNTSGAGTTAAVLSIDTTQGGFLAPTGPNGALDSSAGGSFGNTSGSLSYTSDYQGANSPTLVFPVTGTNGSFSSDTGPVPVGTVPSGYSLSNHFLISIAKGANTSLGGTGTATLTAVPEPASVVMLVTALPVPLVLMGLLRRRKAAKAAA
jgi:hypothetical protein